MLNRVILMGRITHDLEVRQTQSGQAVLSFQLAVDRRVKAGAERQSDFIRCTAWGQQAEFISRYFGKGRMIGIVGELRKREYVNKKTGEKHYPTEVYVTSVSFTGEPKPQNNAQGNGYNNNYQQAPQNGYNQQMSVGQPAGNNTGYNQAPPVQSNPPMQEPPAQEMEQQMISDFEDFESFTDDGVPF